MEVNLLLAAAPLDSPSPLIPPDQPPRAREKTYWREQTRPMHHHTTSFSLGGRIQVRVSSWESKSPELLKTITTCTQEEGLLCILSGRLCSILPLLTGFTSSVPCNHSVSAFFFLNQFLSRKVLYYYKIIVQSTCFSFSGLS